MPKRKAEVQITSGRDKVQISMPPYASGFKRTPKTKVYKARKGGKKKKTRFSRSPAFISTKPMNFEYKWVDSFDTENNEGNFVEFILDSTVEFDLLNPVSSGSSYFQRVGNKIKGKYLRIMGQIYPFQVGDSDTEFIRVGVVYDRSLMEHHPRLPTYFRIRTVPGIIIRMYRHSRIP